MLDEINKSARKAENPVVSAAQIDAAFAAIVKNSDHFKDWKNRLNEYFAPDERAFLQEILVCAAHENSINPRRLHDFAVKHRLQNSYMELVQGLEHDGYLLEQGGGHFAFVSPFLQAFWKRDNPIFNA